MAQAFDKAAFLSGSAPAPMPMTAPTENPAPSAPDAAAQPAVASNPVPTGFDKKRFLNDGKAVDPVTAAEVPIAFSGNTPETAMNRSPLSATDRMKLSFGDTSGNINYLKQKYDEVKPVTGKDGKPTKELAVRQGNTWFRVDPDNGSITDPWKLAQSYKNDISELPKDLADMAGTAVTAGTAALTTGAGIAAAALSGPAAPGAIMAAGALGGAAGASARTSLGRIMGTYDATPSEQAWDIGFESMLNAAGEGVALGVKPTAKVIANKLGAVAQAFKDTIEPAVSAGNKMFPIDSVNKGIDVNGMPKAILGKLFATYSVGVDNFNKMIEQPGVVSSTMRRLQDMTGSSTEGYHDQAIREQVGEIGKIAGDTRNTLSQIYGSMRNKLLAKVSDKFSVNLEDSVYSAYNDALQKGLGVLKVGTKEIGGKDAIDFIAKNGTNKAAFRLLSPEELQLVIAQGGSLGEGVGYVAAHPEAHAALSSFYDQINKFAGGVNRTGAKGAADLLDFKKVVTDLANTATSGEALQGAYDVKQVINRAKSAIDDNVFQALKSHGADGDFLALNSTYDKLSTNFAPLLNAQKRAIASGDTKAYESLLSTFLARPSPSASARFAIDDAMAAASSNGLDGLAAKLATQKNNIQVLEAAKAFNPLQSGEKKAAKLGLNAIGIAAYAASHPALGALAIGANLLTSPKTVKYGIAGVQGLAAGQEFLVNQTPKALTKFLANPQAVSSFIAGITQAPLVRMQSDQNMQQALQQGTSKPQ